MISTSSYLKILTEWLDNQISERLITCYNYDEFNILERIGEGANAEVHKAEWKNSNTVRTVALKFMKSLKIFKKFDFHPNVIKFLAVTKGPSHEYIVILEYADDGNLLQYLNNNFSSFKWADKLRIAKEIAFGITFLHEQDIIHRDFHILNILVHKRKMKIADFGLSTYGANSNSTNYEIAGIPTFIDPQALNDSNYVLTKKSDNYGLGVILWVISSCRMPFENIPKQEIIFHILQGKREKAIENTPLEYINLYKRCWEDDPESRPNSNKILEDLEHIISIE
ncbi:kinase-like domain-containing protein [Gigaspora rosea]|nr:kinase-like domain-containing protein [Gigaspora rosea]